jgi:hypothetical protein
MSRRRSCVPAIPARSVGSVSSTRLPVPYRFCAINACVPSGAPSKRIVSALPSTAGTRFGRLALTVLPTSPSGPRGWAGPSHPPSRASWRSVSIETLDPLARPLVPPIAIHPPPEKKTSAPDAPAPERTAPGGRPLPANRETSAPRFAAPKALDAAFRPWQQIQRRPHCLSHRDPLPKIGRSSPAIDPPRHCVPKWRLISCLPLIFGTLSSLTRLARRFSLAVHLSLTE